MLALEHLAEHRWGRPTAQTPGPVTGHGGGEERGAHGPQQANPHGILYTTAID